MTEQSYQNVIEPFLLHAQATPDRLCVVSGENHVTYAELARLVKNEAALFAERGIKPGDTVAYMAPNSIEIISVYLAIQYLGAVAVPLNYRLIPREIAFLCNAVNAKLLLFDHMFDDKIQECRTSLHEDTDLIAIGEDMPYAPRLWTLLGKPLNNIELFRNETALSRIQFTGGSTGIPKGACRTHLADIVEIDACIASNDMAAVDNAVVLIQCPLEHHGGHSWFLSALTAGATVIVCGKFNPQTILESIQRYEVTHMILLPPTTYIRLLREGNIENYDLSSVKIVQSAAGAMPREAIRMLFDSFPNAELNYGWGQSESGTGTSVRISREDFRADVAWLSSVGKPMKTLEIRIIDDNGKTLPANTPGEAIVRTPAMMTGYYNQPALTEMTFTEDGWLRTGDIMRIDEEGFCYVLSRKKDMIKSGGENVFAGEVQAAILRDPRIADCVIFGVPDPVMGETVCAVVQPVRGVTLTKEDVQEACKTYIASYKKPREIVFTDNIGRDDAGKIRLDKIIDYFMSKRAISSDNKQ